MIEAFRLRLRVRYSECDAQGVVFNARWGDYIDIAVAEYTRAIGIHALDWQLVKQTIEWRSPARYDDVLDLRVHTLRVGTTSFAVATDVRRGDTHLAAVETIYVMVDHAGKCPVPPHARAALERGAPGVVIDQAGR